MPFTFVLLALLLLLLVPVLVSSRVRRLRHDVSDSSDQAVLLVSDLETQIATQLYLRNAITGRSTLADIAFERAWIQQRADMTALDSLVRRVDARSVTYYTQLHAMLARWHAASSVARAEARAAQPRPPVLAAAEQLEDHLASVSATRRARIARLDELDVVLAIVLVPVALLSALVVLWMSRSLVSYAWQLERERQALAHSMDAQAALVRGVTHDVKNPLSAASGYAELLAEGIAGPLRREQTEMLQRMRRLISVAVDTVTELLALSQAEAGKLSIERQTTDLAQLVKDTADDYRAVATEKHLDLRVAEPEAPAIVSTDPARARQILANLFSNAIKYTPAGGQIAVSITPMQRLASDDARPQRIGVQVRDNGPGIPPGLKERIFDEFFRVPSTRAAASGAGVGLAIGRRLARMLDGDVTADDAPEGGAVFTLWLPAVTR